MTIQECSAAVVWPAYAETEAASRYGQLVQVAEAGPAGLSDRDAARAFAARVKYLLADAPDYEIRLNYTTGEKSVHRRAPSTWRPSLAMRRRQVQLASR